MHSPMIIIEDERDGHERMFMLKQSDLEIWEIQRKQLGYKLKIHIFTISSVKLGRD